MDIKDLEDIINILIDMLLNKNVSKEEIVVKLRNYHYCFDCRNHYRSCRCGESESNSEPINDNTSSEYSHSDTFSD